MCGTQNTQANTERVNCFCVDHITYKTTTSHRIGIGKGQTYGMDGESNGME